MTTKRVSYVAIGDFVSIEGMSGVVVSAGPAGYDTEVRDIYLINSEGSELSPLAYNDSEAEIIEQGDLPTVDANGCWYSTLNGRDFRVSLFPCGVIEAVALDPGGTVERQWSTMMLGSGFPAIGAEPSIVRSVDYVPDSRAMMVVLSQARGYCATEVHISRNNFGDTVWCLDESGNVHAAWGF